MIVCLSLESIAPASVSIALINAEKFKKRAKAIK